MNPYILQSVAAERTRDLHKEAAAARRARLVRRARRGGITGPRPEISRRSRIAGQPSEI